MSGLEVKVANQLLGLDVNAEYEAVALTYTIEKTYNPDFKLPNGVLVEVKGYFPSEDRAKMRAVKRAHPDRDIRILFGNAHTKINKNSKTTYAMWADKNGFPWADKVVPKEWVT